ncbi:MAG TPA: hypothetical protein VKY74_18470 [Chloroflexia bacterium]|nr:hypothetical protein [Chloroflexia bacterium]
MQTRRPPLAEIDTWALWQAAQAGRWAEVRPWLLLLAGFCAVLAGLVSFFWLTAPGDVAGLLLALLLFSFFLYGRLSPRRAFAAAAMAVLLATAAGIFGIWLLAFAGSQENVWIGILGVLLECSIGLGLGLAGIKRLGPAE